MKIDYIPTGGGTEPFGTTEVVVLRLSGGWANALKLGTALVGQGGSPDYIVGRSGGVVSCIPEGMASTHMNADLLTLDWRGIPPHGRSVAITLCSKGATSAQVAMSKRYRRRAPYGWLEARRPGDRHVRYWEQFGRPQLCALVELVPSLIVPHPELRFICGHEDLVRGAIGPGPAFPWALLDYEELGLIRMEKDWESGLWYERRGRRRKEVAA